MIKKYEKFPLKGWKINIKIWKSVALLPLNIKDYIIFYLSFFCTLAPCRSTSGVAIYHPKIQRMCTFWIIIRHNFNVFLCLLSSDDIKPRLGVVTIVVVRDGRTPFMTKGRLWRSLDECVNFSQLHIGRTNFLFNEIYTFGTLIRLTLKSSRKYRWV